MIDTTRADEFREKFHEQALRTAVMLDITGFDPVAFFAQVTTLLLQKKKAADVGASTVKE